MCRFTLSALVLVGVVVVAAGVAHAQPAPPTPVVNAASARPTIGCPRDAGGQSIREPDFLSAGARNIWDVHFGVAATNGQRLAIDIQKAGLTASERVARQSAAMSSNSTGSTGKTIVRVLSAAAIGFGV